MATAVLKTQSLDIQQYFFSVWKPCVKGEFFYILHYFTAGVWLIFKCIWFLLSYGLLNFIIAKWAFLELLS